MAGKIDDETLSRWLDDALQPAEAGTVADAMMSDDALAARADAIKMQDSNIRSWFDDQLAQPPIGLEHSVKAAFAARRAHQRSSNGRQWWLPAVAAAVVLVAGFAGFNHAIDSRVNDALDRMRTERASDMAMLASAVQEVLENRESGVEVSFENDQTGLAVTLIPRRTWKSASGHWCREFAEVVGSMPPEDAAVSTACRTSEGQWKRISTEVPGVLAPIILEAPDLQDL